MKNSLITMLAKNILAEPKFKMSPAQTLTFSAGWMSKYKNRYNLVKRASAKTHITKVKPEDIDAWQIRTRKIVIDNDIPKYLNGNKDETPTKLNVSTADTIDLKGTADVRYADQGHLKSQYTTYTGGWAGAMKSAKELLKSRPTRKIVLNDFTRDGHILPSMSIFKGKTAQVLKNVITEALEFDPNYLTYLTSRSPEVSD